MVHLLNSDLILTNLRIVTEVIFLTLHWTEIQQIWCDGLVHLDLSH
jgi:hypothetical protein